MGNWCCDSRNDDEFGEIREIEYNLGILPKETWIQIIQCLGTRDAFHFSVSCRLFWSIFFPSLTQIDGMGRLITPRILRKLTNIKCLSLELNKHCSDKDIIFLTKLESLTLCGNYINGSSFSNLCGRLTSLCLDNTNYISDDSLRLLTSLTELYLFSNRLLTDSCLLDLLQLKKLVLSDQRNFGDSVLLGLPNLQSLSLSGINQVTGFELHYLSNLTTLELNTLSRFEPNYLNLFTQLRNLSLSYNYFVKYGNISKLNNLTFLDLSFYALINWGDIYRLHSLTRVDISHNIKMLPIPRKVRKMRLEVIAEFWEDEKL